MTDQARVLVVDDDPMARRAIATVVDSDAHLRVAGGAADGADALTWLRTHDAELVLLDIRMAGRDGLDTLTEMRRDHPELVVVMLTTFSDGDLVARALADGASGFLLKTSAPHEITGGLRAALAGEMALSPRVARWVVDHWTPAPDGEERDARARVDALTERQRDTLTELAAGSSNAEIGAALGLTEPTVKGYVSDVLAALGARNRVEAALVAYRAGLR